MSETSNAKNTNEAQNPYAPPKHDSVPIYPAGQYMDYTAIQSNYVLRAAARKQLQGVWGKMALAFFIYLVITVVPQFLFSERGFLSYIPALEMLITIAVAVVSGPFALGWAGFYLKRVRGDGIAIGNIFDGFSRFFQSFLAMFFFFLFTLLWSLLLIVPGIIKAIGYSMVFNILYDNPEMKPLEALKKSQTMMKGYKLKYFLLSLSFIGWFLLGLLTLGIGWLWITPYAYLSFANFYENLKRNQENTG
ncbi:MAG: DUF975 family protein [Spirochaetes bacterium]|nr:DUF975 family protein [Spirochaetota bacterium]